jgi:hypothetical protein
VPKLMDIFASLMSNAVRLAAEPLVLRAGSLRAKVTVYSLPDWAHIGIIRISLLAILTQLGGTARVLMHVVSVPA